MLFSPLSPRFHSTVKSLYPGVRVMVDLGIAYNQRWLLALRVDSVFG